MSSKQYTEKNVVKIKNDIIAISKELAAINILKDQASAELRVIETEIAEKRKFAKTYEDKILTIMSDAHKASIEEVTDLTEKKVVLSGQIQRLTLVAHALSKEISKERPERPNTYMNSLIKVGRNMLLALSSQIAAKEETLSKIEYQVEEVGNNLNEVKKIEKQKVREISVMNDEIEEAAKKLEQLVSSRDQLRREVEENKMKEHDLKVMEQRLTPEYQEAYNRIPNRKKR